MIASFFGLTFATFLALVPIVNPFSTAPLFLTLTHGDSEERRAEQARSSIIYMVCILTVFLVAGSLIMNFFGISLPGMRIAGGILVSGVGLRMLYPTNNPSLTQGEREESMSKRDISFFPLAMPSLAGPGSIAVTISLTTLAERWWDFVALFVGILGLAALVYGVMRVATHIVRFLGVTGVHAMTKIMGFLIFCIGIQFVVNGITAIITDPQLIQAIQAAMVAD